MLDMFDTPILPGLSTRPNVVSDTEEEALIASIDNLDLTPFRFQGWTGKRLTHSFGLSYDFEKQRAARADPIPEWLRPIRRRMAIFANLDPEDLVQALLIRYDQGAGIGWHRDRPIYEHVVGLSLGALADMRFRRRRADGRFERISLSLEPRAVYHLSGEARYEWEHSIIDMDRTRWSITFRTASAEGRSILQRAR